MNELLTPLGYRFQFLSGDYESVTYETKIGVYNHLKFCNPSTRIWVWNIK